MQQVQQRRLGHLGTGPVFAPTQTVHAVREGEFHELVIGGVVIDLVQSPSVSIEDTQARRVAIRLLTQELYALAAHLGAQGGQCRLGPGHIAPQQRLA
jgi:hypothetical protein